MKYSVYPVYRSYQRNAFWERLRVHQVLDWFLSPWRIPPLFEKRYLLRDTHSYLTCYLVSVFTLLLLCFRSEESLSVLLHLHHVHQGSVGWREDIGRLCSRIQGSSSRGIRKWLHSLKSTISVPAGCLIVKGSNRSDFKQIWFEHL